MNAFSFIGSKISLVSRAGIRYEGILQNIDSDNSTVSLSKVKTFGTEDRCADAPIPPREEVYDYIMFRGSDIQDIHVSEYVNKNLPLMSQDSAIIKVSGATNQQDSSNEKSQRNRSPQDQRSYRRESASLPRYGGNSRMPSGSFQDARFSSRFRSRDELNTPTGFERGRRRNPGRQDESPLPLGYFRSPNMRSGNGRYFGDNTRNFSRRRRVRSQSRNDFESEERKAPTDVKYPSDYDFETENAKIAGEFAKMNFAKKQRRKPATGKKDSAASKEGSGDKASDEAESNGSEIEEGAISDSSVSSADVLNAAATKDVASTNCYDKKKSFFDNISSEDNDRARGKNVRSLNWRDEKKLNSETFGVSQQRGQRNSYYSGYYYGMQDRARYMRMNQYAPYMRNRAPFWRNRFPLYEPRPIVVGWR